MWNKQCLLRDLSYLFIMTTKEKEPEFLDFFKEVPDHRIERRKLYSVEEILLLSFCAVISGCSIWDDIELYGQTKLDELRLYS